MDSVVMDTCTACAAGEPAQRVLPGSAQRVCRSRLKGRGCCYLHSVCCQSRLWERGALLRAQRVLPGASTLGVTGCYVQRVLPGKYTGATGAANCTACAVGESTLGAAGAVSCTTCPKGTWSGRTGQAECIACNQADWCLGGNSCAEGHQGEACFECTKDWYMLGDVCYPCKQDAKFFLLVFLGILMFAGFIAAVVFPGKVKAGWNRLQRAKKQAEDRVEKIQEKIQQKTLGERSSKFGAVVFLVSLITTCRPDARCERHSIVAQRHDCVLRGAGRHRQL